MNFLIVFLCILFALYVHIKDKRMYHPVKLYMLLWGVLFFVYNLNWYPLPFIKQRTYDIVLTGLFSFMFGVLLTHFKFKKKTYVVTVERQKLINAALVFFFITMIKPFMNGFRLLMGGVDLHDIRYVYHDDIVGTGIGAVIFVYFSEPFLVFYLIYAVVNVYNSKKPIMPIVLSVLGIIMMIVARGGRFYLLYFIFAVFIAMMIYRKSNISKRVNKFVATLGIIGLTSIVGVSVIRGADVGRTFYVYLSGSIPFLDHLLNDYGDLPATMGVYSLNGFIRTVFVVLRAFGIMDMPVFMQIVEEISLQTDEAYSIMPGELYNSFTTLFYSLYMDGGLFGVFLGNFILAATSMVSYYKLDRNNTASVVLFLLLAVMLLLSFFRLLIVSYSYALAFLYVSVCFKTKKVL